MLVTVDDVDSFREVHGHPVSSVIRAVLDAVRSLDEREELEPFIRTILADPSDTPHGPAEIVDILTHKLTVRRESGLAAFILKGRSFPTVRPKHVSHQIYRIEKISDLRFAVFAASGTVLDAAKEQFCSTASRLGCDYLLLDAVDLGRLFVAYGFLCPRDGNKVHAGRCRCGYSPSHRVFNFLQETALTELRCAHGIGQRAALVVLPPGSGKTRIAAEDAKRADVKRVLYVAHTHEILDVAQSEFAALFGESNVRHHINRTDLRRLGKINLTSIQLLQHNPKAISAQVFDYVVIDEFHHAAAASYRYLLEQTSASSSKRFLLGLTATPFRGDQQDITLLCEGNIVVNFDLRGGIDCGVLSPYHYYGCFDDIDYSRIRHNGTSYDIRDLERALIVPERDEAVVRHWRSRAEDKPTLAFCCSHRHATRVARRFSLAGVPARPYLSTTGRAERQGLIEQMQDGEVKVLCVVDVVNEGADLPFIECLLFLRPTESKRIFYQQLGRGLRRYVGKSHCLVIDFIGNFRNAYRVVEYQGLLPFREEGTDSSASRGRSEKEILNLPLGCKVEFDERVIDVFAQQSLNPAHITRHNIARVLIYQYHRLRRRLGRNPTRRDVDRNLLLHSEFYKLVFGSWKRFEDVVLPEIESTSLLASAATPERS